MPLAFLSVTISIGFPSNTAFVVVFVTELPSRTAETPTNAAERASVNIRGILYPRGFAPRTLRHVGGRARHAPLRWRGSLATLVRAGREPGRNRKHGCRRILVRVTFTSEGLQFRDVRKSFGAVKALRGVSFDVLEG